MDTIVQFRKALLRNFTDLQDGTLKPKEGNAMANTAGKVLSSCKLELAYNQFMGRKDHKIDFLEPKEIKK